MNDGFLVIENALGDEEVEFYLAALDQGQDVVIGTRKHPDANIQLSQPWLRVHLGLQYTRLVNLLTGTHCSVYTCGFKAFRRRASQEIFSRSRVQGWSFDAETLFLAHRLGFAVGEIPVTWRDDPDSKVKLLRAVIGSFAELLKIRYHHLRGHYPLASDRCRCCRCRSSCGGRSRSSTGSRRATRTCATRWES